MMNVKDGHYKLYQLDDGRYVMYHRHEEEDVLWETFSEDKDSFDPNDCSEVSPDSEDLPPDGAVLIEEGEM